MGRDYERIRELAAKSSKGLGVAASRSRRLGEGVVAGVGQVVVHPTQDAAGDRQPGPLGPEASFLASR